MNYLIFSFRNPKNSILQKISQYVSFEIVAGNNGRVWVKTDNIKRQIILANLISSTDGVGQNMIPSLIEYAISQLSSWRIQNGYEYKQIFIQAFVWILQIWK